MPRVNNRKKPLIDWEARRKSIDMLREVYGLSDDIQDTADELEAEEAHQREMARCIDDMERHPQGHHVNTAAMGRLAHLQSRRHAAKRTVKLELKKSVRRAKHELAIGLAPVIDMLFIVVFNVAAIMLFFWLLSLI